MHIHIDGLEMEVSLQLGQESIHFYVLFYLLPELSQTV